MSDDEVEDLIANIANDIEAPVVEHIHAIAASRKQKRQAASRIGGFAAIAVLIAGLGFWATRPEPVELTTGDDTSDVSPSPAVADDSAPQPMIETPVPNSDPLSEESFGDWMIANRLRDDRRPFVALAARDSDPTTNGVRLHVSAFPLDGSFEYFAVVYAECGPRLHHGMIRFVDDSADFASGRLPDSEDVSFDDVGYDCSPPTAGRLGQLLSTEFEILPTASGLRLSNGTDRVDFISTDLEGNPVSPEVFEPDGGDDVGTIPVAQRRLIATPRWFGISRADIPESANPLGELVSFGDNQIGFSNCKGVSYDITWTQDGFTVERRTPVDPNVEVPAIGCPDPADGLLLTPMPSGLEVKLTENSDRTITLTSSEWQLTLSAMRAGEDETRIYVSLPIDDAAVLAEANDLLWRVVYADGQELGYDLRLQPNRLNFTTQDGIVIHVRTDAEMAAQNSPQVTTTTTVQPGDDDLERPVKDEYLERPVEEAGALAEANGLPWRVIRRDGVDQVVTLDLRPGRLNFTVRDGIVTGVAVETA